MNKTVKISLGRVAFTLNEDAHELLKHYLDKLSAHYADHANGQEIVDGIEEHIAELLLDRNFKERIVDLNVVQEVIERMGEPADIDQDAGVKEPKPARKKRLYRNPQRRFMAGVCGGLSVLLNWDVVLVRLAFVGAALLGFYLSVEGEGAAWFLLMPLLYLILWAIIPQAKTFEQRCEMNGVSPSIPDVEKIVENGDNLQQDSDNTDLLSRFARLIVRIFGFGFLVSGFFVLSGIAATYIGFRANEFPLHTLCRSFGIASGEILLLLAFVCCGLLFFYWGILLIFRLKPLRWKPGLWLFLLSAVCGIAGTFSIFVTLIPIANSNTELSNRIHVGKQSMDTLFVVMENHPEDLFEKTLYHFEAGYNQYECMYFNGDWTDPKIVCYPELIIMDNNKEDFEIWEQCEYTHHINPKNLLVNKDETYHARISADTLYVRPFHIANLQEVEIVDSAIYVNAPKNTVIQLVNPMEHTFRVRNGRHIEFSTFDL